MKKKNLYLTDVFQPISMVVPGAQCIINRVWDVETEFNEKQAEIISAVKRPIYSRAVKKLLGIDLKASVRDLEFVPGDVIYYVKSIGEPIDLEGSEDFPSGNTLAIYKVEVYSNESILIKDKIE